MKMMKRLAMTLVFTFAFLLFGFVSVNAATTTNNTTIGDAMGFSYEDENFYITDGSIKLNSKKNGFTQSDGNYANYEALVTVAFKEIVEGELVWHTYEYNATSKNRAATTMDSLKKGLTLDLNKIKDDGSVKALNEEEIKEINGVDISALTGIYGEQLTYFVTVRYYIVYKGWTAIKYGFQAQPCETEVYKVTLASNLETIGFTSTKEGTTTRVVITSGTPINLVRYFHTATALEDGYDYDTEFTNSNTGVELSTALEGTQTFENGKFTYTLVIENASETSNYYVEATDFFGNTAAYNVTDKVIDSENDGQVKPTDPADGNVGNTNVGKIILISLLVVLVISLVLVIVQRIVDYRKKLY